MKTTNEKLIAKSIVNESNKWKMAIENKVNENDNGYEKSKSNENDKKKPIWESKVNENNKWKRYEKVKVTRIINKNDSGDIRWNLKSITIKYI